MISGYRVEPVMDFLGLYLSGPQDVLAVSAIDVNNMQNCYAL